MRARNCVIHLIKFRKPFRLTVHLLVIEGDKESAIQSSVYRMVFWYFLGQLPLRSAHKEAQ